MTLLAAALIAAGCSSGPKRDVGDFCSAYVRVAKRAAHLADPDEVSIPTLRRQIAAIDDAASDAAERAPESIAPRVDKVIAPLHTLRKKLDDAKTRSAATTALRRYRSATARVAPSQRVLDLYAAAHCGVVPVTTTSTTLDPDTPGMTG